MTDSHSCTYGRDLASDEHFATIPLLFHGWLLELSLFVLHKPCTCELHRFFFGTAVSEFPIKVHKLWPLLQLKRLDQSRNGWENLLAISDCPTSQNYALRACRRVRKVEPGSHLS